MDRRAPFSAHSDPQFQHTPIDSTARQDESFHPSSRIPRDMPLDHPRELLHDIRQASPPLQKLEYVNAPPSLRGASEQYGLGHMSYYNTPRDAIPRTPNQPYNPDSWSTFLPPPSMHVDPDQDPIPSTFQHYSPRHVPLSNYEINISGLMIDEDEDEDEDNHNQGKERPLPSRQKVMAPQSGYSNEHKRSITPTVPPDPKTRPVAQQHSIYAKTRNRQMVRGEDNHANEDSNRSEGNTSDTVDLKQQQDLEMNSLLVHSSGSSSIDNMMDSIIRDVKHLVIEDLVVYAHKSNGNHDADEGTGPRSEALSSGGDKKGTMRSNSSQKRPKKKPPSSEDNIESDFSEEEHPRKRKSKAASEKPRLKCPFYQNSPEKHRKASCKGEGFADLGKLKDHLRRVHTQPRRCERCWEEMTSSDSYREHLQSEVICTRQLPPSSSEDKIPFHVLEELKFKKPPFSKDTNAEERWKRLYKILFPGESLVPSPYETYHISPNFERALCKEIEKEISKEISILLDPALNRILQRIKARIPDIIRICNARLGSDNSDATDSSHLDCEISIATNNPHNEFCGFENNPYTATVIHPPELLYDFAGDSHFFDTGYYT